MRRSEIPKSTGASTLLRDGALCVKWFATTRQPAVGRSADAKSETDLSDVLGT